MRAIKGVILSAVNLAGALAALILLLGIQQPYPWLQWYGQVFGGVAILMVSFTAADQGKKAKVVDDLPLYAVLIAALATTGLGALLWLQLPGLPGVLRALLGTLCTLVALIALEWAQVLRGAQKNQGDPSVPPPA